MSDYNSTDNSSAFASSGVGTAGLTLGVIGTALASGILGNGGLGGLFGNSSTNAAISLASKDAEIARLQAVNSMTEKFNGELVDVYTELRKQDKNQDSVISALNSRVLALETAAPLREQVILDQVNAVASTATASANSLAASIAVINNTLAGLTKTVIPNTSVCPGWGSVTITPATSTASTT